MRAFLVTSPKFNGMAEIWYNTKGILVRIDTIQTDMDTEAVTLFKRAVSPSIDGLRTSLPSCDIVEKGADISFLEFWNKYNYKVEKKRTEALWKLLSTVQRVKAFYSVDAYERFLKRKDGKIEKKYPDTYLRSEAFETEWDKIK